jgi:hypothetical protein
MKMRKVIQRRIRHRSPGVDLVSDINAVVSANVGTTRSAAPAEQPGVTDASKQRKGSDERAE